MKKSKLLTALIALFIFPLSSCNFFDGFVTGAKDAGEKIWNGLQVAWDWTKNEAVDLYGKAKDGAVYVYDKTADFFSDAWDYTCEKADQIIGNIKDFACGIDSDSEIKVDEDVDYSPYATVVSENFVSYQISKQLVDSNLNVYPGVAYYKDKVFGGLIFEDGSSVDIENEAVDCCGFIQLVPEGYTGEKITSDIVEQSLIAVRDDETSKKPYLVSNFYEFDDEVGIKDNTIFSFKQTSDYVMEINFYENTTSNRNKYKPHFDYDQNKTLLVDTESSSKEELKKLLEKNSECANAAIDCNNAISDYIERNNVDATAAIVMNEDFLNNFSKKIEQGEDAAIDFTEDYIASEKNDIKRGQVIEFGESVNNSVVNEVDASRVTDGLINTVSNALALGVTSKIAVSTLLLATNGGRVVLSAIVVTTLACSIVYNISNIIEGIQDIHYGHINNNQSSTNPVLVAFNSIVGNEELGKILYHVWGVTNELLCSLMNPIAGALKLAKLKALGFFESGLVVARACLTKIAQFLITGTVGAAVGLYMERLIIKVSNNNCVGRLVGFASGVISSMIVATGLNAFDQKFNISGLYYGDVVTDKNGIKHYLDDKGNEYRIGNDLKPNNTFEKNGYTFTTDANGRTIRVSGKVTPREGGRQTITDSISNIGKGSEMVGDDRGHLAGDQMGGPCGMENMVPQNSSVNRGEYAKLENELTNLAREGNDVRTNIQPQFEGDSRRPFQIIYEYIINGISNIRVFNN